MGYLFIWIAVFISTIIVGFIGESVIAGIGTLVGIAFVGAINVTILWQLRKKYDEHNYRSKYDDEIEK